MPKTIKLEIEDTGSATANLILLFNKWLDYAHEEARLTSMGVSRLVSVFRDDSVDTANIEKRLG